MTLYLLHRQLVAFVRWFRRTDTPSERRLTRIAAVRLGAELPKAARALRAS